MEFALGMSLSANLRNPRGSVPVHMVPNSTSRIMFCGRMTSLQHRGLVESGD